MKFIQAWSYSCANQLTLQLKENHEKRRVYYFGFQIIIGGIVKFVLMVMISLLLGTLLPTLLITAFFASLRVIAGGYHMNTYAKCIITSLALFVLVGVVVQYTYPYWGTIPLLVFAAAVYISAVFILKKWAPADTPHKPITEPEEIRKFKRLSLLHVSVWFPLMLVLLYFNLKMYVLSGCFGVLISIFIVTPFGYGLFDRLSGRIDKVKEK